MNIYIYRKERNLYMKKFLCLTLALAVTVSLSSCGKKKEETAAEPTAAPTNVTVQTADLGTIMNSVTNTGEVVPVEEVGVSAKLSGKAVSSSVEVGKYVKAGDVLFSIDDTDYRLQVNQARAAVESAQAGYESAQAGYNSTVGGTQQQSVQQVEQALTSAKLAVDSAQQNYDRQKQLAENNSNVVLAQNGYNDAKAAYDRTKSLFDAGVATQVALDSAETAMLQAEENLKTATVNANASLEAAETTLKNAQEALATAQKNYDLTTNVLNPEREKTAKSSVQSAASSILSAQAAYDIAMNTLSNTTVRAPISGYITSSSVTVGQMVQAGAPMVTIIDTHSMDIKLKVTESVVTGIKAGSEAKISVKSANIENLPGTVATVSPSKDAQTGLFEVVINVPNAEGVLKGGMFADVTIVTEKYDGVLCIPATAVLTENDKSYVYVEQGGSAVKKEITLGKSDDTNVEALSGVSQGENVIVKGKEYITESNTAVKIVTE